MYGAQSGIANNCRALTLAMAVLIFELPLAAQAAYSDWRLGRKVANLELDAWCR